ncbi:unnamed protein product [Closterium sp. NIES-54]
MTTVTVLAFNAEGHPLEFESQLEGLHLYLQSVTSHDVSLFEHRPESLLAPVTSTEPTTGAGEEVQQRYRADRVAFTLWTTRDATARLAVRAHLPVNQLAHFRQPTSLDTCYCAALQTYFLAGNQPPVYLALYFLTTCLPDSLRTVRDHFLSLDPTELTLASFETRPLKAETNARAIAASRGSPSLSFLEGSSPSLPVPSVVPASAVDVLGAEEVGPASPSRGRYHSRGGHQRGWGGGGGGGGGSGGGGRGGGGGGRGGSGGGGGGSESTGSRGQGVGGSRGGADGGGGPGTAAQVATSSSVEAATVGSCATAKAGTVPEQALHTFTLDSGTSRCFFRDCTTLTPLTKPPVTLADPFGGQVVACSTIVLPCPAAPSSSLTGFHIPSFATNLVSQAALQDVLVTTTTSGGELVAICTNTVIGNHLATFTRRLGSGLYILQTESAHVAGSGQVAASCSCRLLMHPTLLWHHHLGHPSLQRLRCMHSHLLVSGLPRSLSPLPPSLAPPCTPCVNGRQRAVPHSSSFPPTTAPLQTLHMDVWGPAPVPGLGRERYFLLVVDDYTRYTTVFPLRGKGEQDLLVLRLHYDCGGAFFSGILEDFCREEGITQTFTLPASPQKNETAERRVGLIMEVARTSMIHAVAPHFLWSFAVRHAAHQLNLWPRVSKPKTLPTLRWTGKVGDASAFRVWGSLALFRNTTTGKLSSRTIRCDDTSDESVCYYRLFPHASSLVPRAPLLGSRLPSDTPGSAEGGDPAADDTAASRRSPRLGNPPEFLPRPSSPPLPPDVVDSGDAGGGAAGGVDSAGADTGGASSRGAEPGGAEPGDAGSGGASSGGAERSSGGGVVGASAGGSRGGQQQQSCRQEILLSQQLREWVVRQGGSGGGAGGAGAGGAGAGGSGSAGAGGAGTGGAGAGGAGAGGTGVGVTGRAGARGTGAGGAGIGGAVQRRPFF